ncbi:thioredoxin family protein [Spirosoma validum]|uniref:Thioredoxin family protein n=1 Tax=Spirosoma validum TaxID=2771355 RepID=A0A927GDX3_9BACT|nr:thioredoxin family protein [Spirosoma validum]MBD2754179.1 thioredoxin family protein [Spirosoma validum]
MIRFSPGLTRCAVWFCFLLVYQSVVHAQALLPGIYFQQGNFTTALAAARTAHKPLFVEVYLKGCPHCEALAPILDEKPVGDFFNANFVSWKVEANSPEADALQKEKQIGFPEYPLCLFFDSDGTLIHVSAVAEKKEKAAFIEEVISVGRTALNPAQRASGYAARFDAGERDFGFLVNYGKYSITRSDNVRLHDISEILGKTMQPDQIKSQIGLYCLQQIIDDIENPAAVYFFSHLGEFKAAYPENIVRLTGDRIIFRALYGLKGGLYPAPKIVQIRDHLIAMGVPVQEAAARTLLKELEAYFREKNTQAAVQRFNDYRREAPKTGIAEYAYIMHYFNEKASDTTYLAVMPTWAADGLKTVTPEQQTTQPVADLYYELAVTYQKKGQKVEALKNAQQGLSVAQRSKIAAQKYESQVASLK